MKRNIIRYHHHQWDVAVDEKLKGKHRDHCLCFVCDRFAPNMSFNCPIAQAVFETCVKFGLTTPVYECSMFVEGEPDLTNLAKETY